MIDSITIGDFRTFLGPALGLEITETEIIVKDGMMEMKCVDPAHVALIKAEMPVDGENMEFIVDLRDLSKALGVYDKNDTVRIYTDSGKLVIKAPQKKRSIRILSKEVTAPRIPELELETVEIPTDALKAAVRFGGDVADHYVLDSTSGEMMIMTDGDTESSEYTFGPTHVSARVGIPADYLGSMVKGLPTEGVTEVGIATDFPLRLTTRTERTTIMCLIAPRIERN